VYSESIRWTIALELETSRGLAGIGVLKGDVLA
jgi:hypothetical protein